MFRQRSPSALQDAQLSGSATWIVSGQTANVAGTFTFGNLAGTALPPGISAEPVTFNPTDSTDYINLAVVVHVTVNQPPLITSATAAMFPAGASTTFAVTATGFPAPAFSLGNAPSWVSLDPTSGRMTVTAPLTSVGTYPFA